jgi:hypothetical protein
MCKTPLEIYLCIWATRKFTAFVMHAVLFSKKCHLFDNFIPFCSNNMFSKNPVITFKYQPDCIKDKYVIKIMELLTGGKLFMFAKFLLQQEDFLEL